MNQPQDCIICLSNQGIHSFNSHLSENEEICHPNALICTECLRTLNSNQMTCIYCKDHPIYDVININQSAIIEQIKPKVINLYNYIYNQLIPICKPAILLPQYHYQMHPNNDKITDYILISDNYKKQIDQEHQFENMVWILALYQDCDLNEDDRNKNITSFHQIFRYIFRKQGIKINEHCIGDVGYDVIKWVYNEVKNDPEAQTEPKYKILQVIVEYYEAFPEVQDQISITDYMFDMLSDENVFRNAVIKWRIYEENDEIVYQRIKDDK